MQEVEHVGTKQRKDEIVNIHQWDVFFNKYSTNRSFLLYRYMMPVHLQRLMAKQDWRQIFLEGEAENKTITWFWREWYGGSGCASDSGSFFIIEKQKFLLRDRQADFGFYFIVEQQKFWLQDLYIGRPLQRICLSTLSVGHRSFLSLFFHSDAPHTARIFSKGSHLLT